MVDFAGADLFALVGATGAGKSSLIDAMIFALYGSVPRYGDRRLVAPVINQQSVEARVAFTFSVTGQRYVAVRVVRAQTGGGATTKEARLERLGAQGEVEEVLAGDADGVTAAVEALLGLAYEHFTTCVVLPQGEFARFLLQKPRDRQALLIELLDLGIYTDMARRAGEHAAVAKERRTISEARRAELGEPSAQRITELHGLIDALGALVDACSAAQDQLDVLATDRRVAQASHDEAQAAAQRLAEVAAPTQLLELAGSITRSAEAPRSASSAPARRMSTWFFSGLS